jgi:hypothetical protein
VAFIVTENSMHPGKQGLVAPMSVIVAGAQWLCLVPHRWWRKALLQAKLNHMMINNQGSATVSLTLNQEGSSKVCNASESSHQYLGAVLFDVISCTSYLRFNWVVQQFEG